MGLVVQVQDARQLDEGVWKARLSPSEIRFLNPKAESLGPFSILLLNESPVFHKDKGTLLFDPATVRLLNAGTSDTAILMIGTGQAAAGGLSTPVGTGSGDANFLRSLPPNLKMLGEALLREVRRRYPGDLTFSASGKYVQVPDNFWTIRPQPRDESFRITVRGRPETFASPGSLEIKPDMGSYSSFKVKQPSQIRDLIRVLEQVRRR